MEPFDHRTVAFAGCPASECGPTWAQQQTWGQLQATDGAPDLLSVPLAVELDDAPGWDAVLGALRTVLIRHEALRTRYPTTREGGLRQVVAAAGELTVPVYDAGSEAELAGRTDELGLVLQRQPFAPDHLPVRAAVLVVAGVPRRLVLAISHLSVDGWGSGLVYDELRLAMAGKALPPVTWQPREQVAFEQCPAGQQRAGRALRYWRNQLARFPPSMFPDQPGRPESPRFKELRFESRAVAAASYLLARRANTSTAAVVLAAYALVLANRAQLPTAFLTLLTPNRAESRTRDAVGNLYQHAPISIDVAGGTFDDLAGRAVVATIKGYRYGHCDADRLAQLHAQVRAEQGREADLRCLINLHLQAQSTRGAHQDRAIVAHQPLPEQPDQIAALAGQSTLTWRSGAQALPVGLYLAVWAIADTASMSLWGDTALCPLATLGSLLPDLERVLVTAVAHESAGTDQLATLALAHNAR